MPIHFLVGAFLLATAAFAIWQGTRPRNWTILRANRILAFLLGGLVTLLVIGAILEIRRTASPFDRWALLTVLLLVPLVLIIRRHPGSPARPGMTWSERWRLASFWHRLLWLYVPMFLVLQAGISLALGSDGAAVVAVLIIPSAVVTIGFFELVAWIGHG